MSKKKTRFVVGGAITATAALAIGGIGIASALGTNSDYRTAEVERASVSESVETTGTVTPVSRYDVAFETAGTVATVDVSVGDVVTAGQILATLDEDELTAAVTEAEQAVTDAEQTLAQDTEAQASGGSTSTAAAANASASTRTDATAVTVSVRTSAATAIQTTSQADIDAAAAKVTEAQQALLAKYTEVQDTITQTNATIASADEICAPFLSAVLSEANDDSTSDTEEADESGSASTDPGTDAGMTLEEAQQALANCQSAITQTRDGQSSVNSGQQEVQDLAAALNDAVSQLQELSLSDSSSESDETQPDTQSDPGTTQSSPGTDTGSGAVPDSSGGAASGGSPTDSASGSSQSVTAEQLLADQAAIDVAQAELEIAQAQLDFSSLTSPASGTVAAVSIAAGDSVTASSDSAVITILGEDGYLVETTVSLNEITKLAVDQSAEATVTATGTTYSGTVSSVGLLNVSTTSTPAYTVLVALDTGDDELLSGGSSQMVIQTATIDDALTVPTSAVHRDGTAATVEVLDGGQVESVTVELGAIGTERTEIISGLTEGQEVVLADLSAQIDSDEESADDSGSLSDLGGTEDSSGFGGSGGSMQGPPSGGFGGQ